MAILSTIKRGYLLIKTATGYVKLLPRTLATLVSMADGSTVESQITSLRNGVNELNSKLIFSTAETAIGTWTDGRTIYRKCFIIGQLTNATSTTRAHGISNLDRPVHLYGSAKDTTLSSNFTVSLPYISSTDVTKQINIGANNTNIVLYHAAGNNKYSAVVVMEYIKS
ncbi:MAG: hypothetical protein HFG95_04040 [Dorea sp.]|nr:hypothetical protein [Dorea sp.]